MINMDAIACELSSVENGVIVFSSSTGKQLLERLSSKADYEKNGKITVKCLDAYISERVKKMTGNPQTPPEKPRGIRGCGA